MEWLITVKDKVDQTKLAQALRELGCERRVEEPPVPLGENEVAIAVSGPSDLPQRAARKRLIKAVHPNSEMELD